MIITHTMGIIPHYKTGQLMPCCNVEVRKDDGALPDVDTICYAAAVDPPNYPMPAIRYEPAIVYWLGSHLFLLLYETNKPNVRYAVGDSEDLPLVM